MRLPGSDSLLRLHRPWVHAVAGSVLILLSTLVTGFGVYDRQNRLDLTRAAIALKSERMKDSERHEEFSQIISTLGAMRYAPAVGSPDRAFDDSQRVLTELQSLARLGRAAEKPTFDFSIVAPLVEQGRRGGGDASLATIMKMEQVLLADAFNLRLNLQKEVDGLQRTVAVLERSRNRMSLAAVVFQIVGLALLLLKEVPTRAAG